jgi:hypothetical protein
VKACLYFLAGNLLGMLGFGAHAILTVFGIALLANVALGFAVLVDMVAMQCRKARR